MKDKDKTKGQLVKELAKHHQRITGLEKSENKRKQAEEELQEEKNKLQSVVDAMEYGLTIQDKDYNISYQNKVLKDIFGGLGRKCYKVYESKDKICNGCPVEMAWKDGKSHTSERKVTMPNGEIGYWENTANPIRDANGKIISCLEIARNITERKQAEERLRASEEKHRTLTENINVGIYRNTPGPKGKFIEANPAIVRIFGYNNRKEFLKTNVANLYQNSRDRKKFNQKILKDGFVKNKELQLQKKDGTPIWGSVSAVAVRDEKGKVKYYDGIIEDITEQKQAEEALWTSSLATETSMNAIFVANLKGMITYANTAAAKTWGYKSREEMIGTNAIEYWTKLTQGRAGEIIEILLKKGYVTTSGELTGKRLDGTEFIVESNSVIIKDESGKPVGMLGSFSNITERKKAEEELKKEHQLLEASQKELRNFSRKIMSVREEEKKNLSASLHDEVGSMAVALSSCLSNIEDEIKKKNMQGAFNNIEESKLMLAETVARLKVIAKDLRPPDLDIIGLPAALREYFSNVTKQTDIKINFNVAADYKKVSDNVAIVLYRIAQEAMNNIIKHAEAKRVKVKLHIRKRGIKLSVHDDGKGFTAESLGGEGRMGIRGMMEMAESLDGEFYIKTEPGKGTKVQVTLPVTGKSEVRSQK